MALNWLPMSYDLDNVFKTILKCLFIKIHDTEYNECMKNKVIIVRQHFKETGNGAAY